MFPATLWAIYAREAEGPRGQASTGAQNLVAYDTLIHSLSLSEQEGTDALQVAGRGGGQGEPAPGFPIFMDSVKGERMGDP